MACVLCDTRVRTTSAFAALGSKRYVSPAHTLRWAELAGGSLERGLRGDRSMFIGIFETVLFTQIVYFTAPHHRVLVNIF